MPRYEYDSKVNRELAKTALDIYMKNDSNKYTEPNQVNSPQVISESRQEEFNHIYNNVNRLLLEYVSEVVVLAEQEIGRELHPQEIEIFSQYLLENIEGLGENGQVHLLNELAQIYH